MALQEKPYWKKEDDDSEPDNRPVNHGYGPYGEPPRIERPAPEPAPEIRHHIPAAPALEGVISWRQNEDVLQKNKAERSREEDDDDDDDEADEQPVRTIRPTSPVRTPDGQEQPESTERQTDVPEATADSLMIPPEHTMVAEQPQQVPEGAIVEAQAQREKASEDTEDDDTPQPHAAIRYPAAKDLESFIAAVPYTHENPPAQVAPQNARPFQAPSSEQPAPQPAQAAFETPAPAMAAAEYGPVAPPAEADPFNLEFGSEDIPPPHVGVTEAVDFRPASPDVPPVEVGDIPPPPPPPNQNPYAYNNGPGMSPNYAPQPAAAAAPRYEQAPAPVDNHRHGEPLAAAVGLGLVAEHIGRKRADTRQQNQFNQFAEQTTQYQQENSSQYARMQEQQRRFNNEQQRQTAEMQRLQQQQQARQEAAPATPYNLEYAPEPGSQTPNTQPPAPENRQQAPRPFEVPAGGNPLHRQYGAERPGQQQARQEAVRPAPGQPANAEGQPEQQAQQEYHNETQPQHKQHVEQSAWHRIVTENGHEVPGAVQYGQEFYRQREHEMLTDKSTANPTAPGSGAAGAVGAAGAQAPGQQFPGQPMPGMQYQQPGHPGALPSGMTNPTLQPGHPTHIDPQHQLPAASSKQVASNMANPWFWIMLILIVGAFFTAALI
jgi:hypothetical protein